MKERKKSKYDTNPLDTDYAKRADDEWGAERKAEPETKEHWPSEAPTKRYDSSIPFSYPSINVPPSYPPKRAEDAAEIRDSQKAPSLRRVVPGLNLPENVTLALAYAPFFIGAVGAGLELFLTPRTETRARFHASQALALHLAAILINQIFNLIGDITGTTIGGKIFFAASTVFFIVAMIRVWKGEHLHVAAADAPASWLNERIDPQKLQKKK
ncbi:MAG: hypothetical protein DMF68_12270 [Acidobacteria bacterium]|nr:MAG: hypothetical protein DMF68_12270 [Acidobacteriota bacterium]